MIRKIILLTAVLFSSGLLFSWDIRSEHTVDWSANALYLEATAYRESGDPALPSARGLAEKALERALPELLLKALSDIPADSQATLGELSRTNKDVLEWYQSLHQKVSTGTGHFTSDLSGLTVRFTLTLCPDLITPLIEHQRSYKSELRLDWEPSGPFTGIIIYIPRDLPVFNTSRTAALEPCLLPKIYDQELKLLTAPYMIDPDALRAWGAVLYTHDLNEKSYIHRIGYYPMRLVARGVFGSRPTDPVIPQEWADKIRSSRDLQRLITQGRVVFVLQESLDTPEASTGP
ncbi:MAG: hypothetical protein JW760_12955 [Spirochaetales bacterium]|nr:hypothetical protein [Spirochaetales bacterium]